MRRGCGAASSVPTPRARLGSWGEQLAGRFLQEQGYRILATNYRCAHGEVDIVAQEGEELVFVEVRTRRAGMFGGPEESLTQRKLQRLLATCQHYVQQHGQEETAWRVDLISVYLEQGRDRRLKRIRHLRHALQL